MRARFRWAAIACLIGLMASASQAASVGPDYPPPGGVTWTDGGGNGLIGTKTWNYSAFDVSGLNALYFGLNQIDYGAIGAGLHGAADAFTLFTVSGTTAEWRASTTWANDVTNVHGPAATRLLMTVTGLGANPWITDLASIGLNVGFGDLGAVVDNSSGSNFSLDWSIQAKTGSVWQGINTVQQNLDHTGYTKSNFATGFYSQASSVPEPTSLALLSGLGVMGLASVRMRRKMF